MYFTFSEFRGGLYCSLYEVVEKTRSGSNLEGLLQKLERDKLVSRIYSLLNFAVSVVISMKVFYYIFYSVL